MVQSDKSVIDFAGREVAISRFPKRIVCLSAAGLDILWELGINPIGYLSKGIASRPEFYGNHDRDFARLGSWMFPDLKEIRKLQPDLILGWIFPHKFYLRKLNQIAPTYLMGGNGYQASFRRLRDIAKLTRKISRGERAIACLQQRLTQYHVSIPQSEYKTVLFMGGSSLNYLQRRFIVETNVGTMGSIISQFARYPWYEPRRNREPGLTSMSLQKILQIDPDIIFVQTYPPSKIPVSKQLQGDRFWQKLQAVQCQNVHEIDHLWHFGNGTHMINLTLDKLVPLIYPELFNKLKSEAV